MKELTEDSRQSRHEWLTVGFVVRYAVFLSLLSLVAMAVWPGWCWRYTDGWGDCAFRSLDLFLWWPMVPLDLYGSDLSVLVGPVWWALLALAFDAVWTAWMARRKGAEGFTQQE